MIDVTIEMVQKIGAQIPLAIMRFAMAFMLLWAFLDKMFGLGFATPAGMGMIDGGSPTKMFLLNVSGPFADMFHMMADFSQITDILLMAGFLLVGMAILLGIGTKIATVAGSLMMLMLYLSVLPITSNPFFDYHLYYIISLFAIYMGGGYDILSLKEKWMGLEIVRRFPILL